MNGNAGLVNGPAEEGFAMNGVLWCKFWGEYRTSEKFGRASAATGVCVGICRDVFMHCLDEARKAGRTGKVPPATDFDVSKLALENGISAEAVRSVLAAFRTVGLVDGYGRIFKWRDMQLTDAEKAKLDELAARKKSSRREAKPSPAEAPAPAPKSEPAEKAKPAPRAKPAPALLPGLEQVKAEENSYRGLTGERLEYFERAWTAYDAPGKKGSKAAAADAFGKIGRSKKSSVKWTAELGERIIAQAARYTSPEVKAARNGFIKNMSTWLNQECWTEDYGAVVAERTQGRRASSGGGSDAVCVSDLAAQLLGGNFPATDVNLGGAVVPPNHNQGDCYECEFTVVSSGNC